MRGGLERWKRGAGPGGVRQAITYAFDGTAMPTCDTRPGREALEKYSEASDSTVTRFIVASGRVGKDELSAGALRVLLPPELAGAVRPLSRRSAQIEANRARLIVEWSAAHGAAAPSVEVLHQIDRRAWAVSRPNKPTDLDEHAWEAMVRDELETIDPTRAAGRLPVAVKAVELDALDIDLLAAQALVDADQRSTASGGRISRFDIRAGATRALARSGIVAPRDQLDAVIEQHQRPVLV